MNEELKPCPFCECTDVQVVDQEGIAWVVCHGCATDGPPTETGLEAAAAWNSRPSPTLIPLPVIDPDLLDTSKEPV